MTQASRLGDLYDASRTLWTGFVEDGKWAGEWVLIDRLSQHARRAYESEFHVSFLRHLVSCRVVMFQRIATRNTLL